MALPITAEARDRPPWDVVGLGCVAVDDLLYVEAFPGPDSKVLIAGERREGGGMTATALVAAARVGARACYLAVLGDDDLSRFALDGLERAGVDCSRVLRRPGARPVHSRIIVEQGTGERTVLYTFAGVTAMALHEVEDAGAFACRVLLVDGTVAPVAHEVALAARRRGIAVVADLEDPEWPDERRLAAAADHLIVGRRYATRTTGATSPQEAVRLLWRADLAACVVTAGADGCWYQAAETAGSVLHQPAEAVRVVDTTGCGDVFHGAYAARIAAGASVADAVRVATRLAAAKAERGAGWKAIPAWSDLAPREEG